MLIHTRPLSFLPAVVSIVLLLASHNLHFLYPVCAFSSLSHHTLVGFSTRPQTCTASRIKSNEINIESNTTTERNKKNGKRKGSQRRVSDGSKEGKGVREGSLMAATIETGKVPYGEKSRRFRRTVFQHGDWVEHRSSNSRIMKNLQSMLFSGVVRQLRSQVGTVAAVAAFVLTWNLGIFPSLLNLWPGLQSFPFITPIILPSIPFTLSSPALGLLLVFRTNASYARWMEARNAMAKIVAQGRNIIRMGSTFSDDKEAVQSLGRATWLYCRSVMNQLSSPYEDEELYLQEVEKVYQGNDSSIGQRIVNSPERTLAAWKQLSVELHSLPVPDTKALIETDKSIIILGDCAAICEKIYSSPVPLVYTRHTARFLSLWALLLPAALYSAFLDLGTVWAVLPASSVLAFFLFGVDELAMQLEEPFSILPMQSFCDQILVASEILAGNTNEDEL
mmetsp:Transcript_25776/g.29464  ORF Transcript_25776/g.29464 Transcript_25776/m.29464 type:complete len:449 (-) Transcript_25776:59-1405(-)|eukprot:CAMPEP_0194142020 /NCGR_PEP_ID=MMETSP0152-20130528/11355_1 /TAXON_ID=1049557 /ORGANISM="Thalassiothrix antarctica, Strain L6-D1" /LENGTH=448 /DNA_ID=CAMNT_0038840825 /DNA_START=66 /DNA_END=1412 /DNA_ORIENTATION=+